MVMARFTAFGPCPRVSATVAVSSLVCPDLYPFLRPCQSWDIFFMSTWPDLSVWTLSMVRQGVKGMYPAPNIHKQSSRTTSTTLSTLRTSAQTPQSTDVYNAQLWARSAASVDAHVFTRRTCGPRSRLVCHPYIHACALVFGLLSVSTRLSTSSSSWSSTSSWCLPWCLWIEAALASKRGNQLTRVPGAKNTADILTKSVSRRDLDKHLLAMRLEIRNDKATEVP